jgi:hypothetical protein
MVPLVAIVAGVLVPAAPPPGKPERVRVEVAVNIGSDKVAVPKRDAVGLPFQMDMKGNVSCESLLLGRMYFQDYVARTLKDQDFMRLEIELDFPDDTPAPLLLKVIGQVTRGVKDGKRVELKFTYLATPEKG